MVGCLSVSSSLPRSPFQIPVTDFERNNLDRFTTLASEHRALQLRTIMRAAQLPLLHPAFRPAQSVVHVCACLPALAPRPQFQTHHAMCDPPFKPARSKLDLRVLTVNATERCRTPLTARPLATVGDLHKAPSLGGCLLLSLQSR